MNELRKDILIMNQLNIKPNYTELGRKYNCDPRTVKKYYEGYEGKPSKRKVSSSLDVYKEEIKEKINYPGATKTGVYQFMKDKYKDIGSYSNFSYFIRKQQLIEKQSKNSPHPRYETPYGKQLQFDWKEDITMTNKYGEVFNFNIFSAILSSSRFHNFEYSKNRTRMDVERCLVKTFKKIRGVTEEILTDNMSSIVNNNTHKFVSEFITFCKDIGVKPKHCKVRKCETKGKVESQNRFMSWLIPYNNEFETEKDLIEIIETITKKVNQEINETTNCSPIFLYSKEKEHLKPLPNKELLEQYENDIKSYKVPNTFLVTYKGNGYSVPPQYINKIVKLIELDNKLYIYYNEELLCCHDITANKINYIKEHYEKGISHWFNKNSDLNIEEVVENNLKELEKLNERRIINE